MVVLVSEDPATPSPGRLLIEVVRAHRAVFAEELSRIGLHVGQELILVEVGRDDGLTQALLTRRLAVERATVSRALTRMERSGFVRRERRGSSTRVRLTKDGREALPAVRALWARVDAELLDAAGDCAPEMMAGLRQLLSRLAAMAEPDAVPSPERACRLTRPAPR
jgi:MarR family transcriptional regulator, organic hydroperoxide resistance regulator